MRIIFIWIGKTVILTLRVFGRRGSALPGLIIESLSKNFVAKSLELIPGGVIIVTGTNGKTTSTKMLTHVLRGQKKVLTNSTGSNFVRGIIAAILLHSTWLGKLDYDIAVFELDEAYAAKFVDIYQPRGMIVLNVMRDQMDRFGEIDYTARLIQKAVAKTTEFVVLNRDDPRVQNMSKDAPKNIYYFRVSQALRSLFRNDDELHKEGDNIVGVGANKADVELIDIQKNGQIKVAVNGQDVQFGLSAKGTFNAQNAMAVLAAGLALDYSVDIITTRLSEVKAAFGRGESIKIDNKYLILQLVKNPSGFRHALISGAQNNQTVTMLAINDNYADGRDVSWLWDVNFKETGGVNGLVATTGSRATDMALRLKYDDIITDIVKEDLLVCLKASLSRTPAGGCLVIYTTYTAMLEIRKLLSSMTKVDKI